MKVANKINGVIKTYKEIPSVFELKPEIGLYNLQDETVHYNDGFRILVDLTPTELQKKGNIIFDTDNDVYTYELIDKTTEELDIEAENKVTQYKQRINDYFSHMYIRALSSSMNKRSSDLNYLLGLREEYKDKYDVSKGNITTGSTYNNTQSAILGEMQDEFTEAYLDTRLPLYGLPVEGTHLEKMYAIIVFKYEYGLNAFNQLNAFIRRFRTKGNKWVDDSEFTKLDNAFAIVDTLPETLSMNDAEDLYNQFNAI